MTEPVRIVPYDPSWPERFQAEKRLLEDVLAPWIVGGVHHIGSTAVPGLAAKPIVDVMVGVEGLEQSLPARPAAESVGYVWAPYRPEVFHWFCKPSPLVRTHHLHLIPFESQLWFERLAFRNALRASQALSIEYAELKLRLAEQFSSDREAYTQAKAPFVQRVLSLVGAQRNNAT